jgi:O-antigen/teichoic acid export membrane protein
MTGTAIAQIIPLAITPILTRLYTPEDFGLLALYLSSVSVLSIVVTGNYEKAIIMPKENRDAIGLIKLALVLASAGCVVVLIASIFFGDELASFYANPSIKDLMIFIPFSVFSLAIYNVINTWLNRAKEYRNLSYNRVTKASISSVLSVTLGAFKMGSLGLIIGEFFGQLLATTLFGRTFYKRNKEVFNTVTVEQAVALGKDHKNFPIYTLPADMLSMASYQLPVFVLGKIFSQTVVGFYSLCVRVLDKPVVFLTSAVYEVFRQKAMEDYANKGNCIEIFNKTLRKLVLMAVPTMAAIFVLSPYLFKFVFGPEWEEAGYYARIISVMYLFRFVASPLSFTFYVANKQRLDFILHIYVFLSSALSLFISYKLGMGARDSLWLFVINYSCVYSFYLVKSYQFARGARNS